MTSDALVLMFAFFALSLSPGTDVKQFAIGLAAGPHAIRAVDEGGALLFVKLLVQQSCCRKKVLAHCIAMLQHQTLATLLQRAKFQERLLLLLLKLLN